MDEFMTIKEVGAYLRVSAQSVKRLIREGNLAAHRIGRCSYRIPGEAVKMLLAHTLASTLVDTPVAEKTSSLLECGATSCELVSDDCN